MFFICLITFCFFAKVVENQLVVSKAGLLCSIPRTDIQQDRVLLKIKSAIYNRIP